MIGGKKSHKVLSLLFSFQIKKTIKTIIENIDNLQINNSFKLIALPTTSGTGSEVTPYATVWDKKNKKKLSINHKNLLPAFAIVDPTLTYDLPKDATINTGLDCLMNTTLPRPNVCTTGLAPGQDLYDSKYNRSNWDFEFHAPPPSQNPGWWDKVNFFVSRVDGLGSGSIYQVVAFKFGYVDAYTGSAIDNVFFTRNANDSYPGIENLEALQTRHPNKLVVLWTMGLARAIGTADSTSFNNQMRTYAIANEVPLMDIADIQSHRPNGTLCVDNQGNNQPALCDEYTEEINGGHLNTLGKQIMAKAYWVMMARLAGWQP